MAQRALILRACLVVALLWLVGCNRARRVPELLTLTELLPGTVQAGDRLEVRGVGLPAGDVTSGRVVFRGDVLRPGEPALRGVVIEAHEARVERDRVLLDVSPELAERFTGGGDAARHATFRGAVEVWLPGHERGLPVHGAIRGETVLDVTPRAQREAVVSAREREAEELLAFLGLELQRADSGRFGVASVRDGGLAQRAGLARGDEIERADGVTVLAPTDLVPSGHGRTARVVVWRGADRVELDVDVTGFRGDAARELVGPLAVMATLLVLLLLLGTRAATPLTWIAHRLMLWRATPRTRATRAAAPSTSAEALSAAAPYLVFAGGTLSFAVLPYAELAAHSAVELTLLFLVTVTAFASVGLVTGRWSERAPGLTGRLRTVAGVVLCNVPAALALSVVVSQAGSVAALDLAAAQSGAQGGVWESGGWPWFWNAAKNPLLFAAFCSSFLSVLVEGSTPRGGVAADVDAAQGSLPRGQGAFFFLHWSHVFIMCAIGTVAFLGGFYVPGFTAHEHTQSGTLRLAGVALFVAKSWGLAGAVLALRAALPRIQLATLLRLGLRVLLPVGVAAAGIGALAAIHAPLPAVERALTLASLVTTGCLLLAILAPVLLARRRGAPRPFARVNALL